MNPHTTGADVTDEPLPRLLGLFVLTLPCCSRLCASALAGVGPVQARDAKVLTWSFGSTMSGIIQIPKMPVFSEELVLHRRRLQHARHRAK
jgi:hypothetical protein